MLLSPYEFPWSDYKTKTDGELTARWFAAWVRQTNRTEIKYDVGQSGPVVTTCPKKEFDDFVAQLRSRAKLEGKLSTVVPPLFREHAQRGLLPEQVIPPASEEGFLIDPGTIDWNAVDISWEAKPKWGGPYAGQVIIRASEYYRLPFARFSLLDKQGALEFLDQIGYKKPFYIPTSTAMAMIFQQAPFYFVPYGKRVLLSDRTASFGNASAEYAARMTWLGDGTNLAHANADPSLFGMSAGLPCRQPPLIRVFLPMIQERLGDLLEPVYND